MEGTFWSISSLHIGYTSLSRLYQRIQYDSKITIFADASKLYKIEALYKFRSLLIRSLFSEIWLSSANWSHTWAMSLSIPKCKTLNISRKKSPSNRKYYLDGTLLTTASGKKDLGITITDILQWSQHRDIIISPWEQTVILTLSAESAETSVRGTRRQFLEKICSEDDLRSKIFGTVVVKFLACLPLLCLPICSNI